MRTHEAWQNIDRNVYCQIHTVHLYGHDILQSVATCESLASPKGDMQFGWAGMGLPTHPPEVSTEGRAKAPVPTTRLKT